MAKLYGEIEKSALLTLDKSFSRALGQPLDPSEVYYSLKAAETYAAGVVAYVGQKIVVIENGVVSHYSIENTDGKLKPLGVSLIEDGDTIAIDTAGKISLANLDEIKNAEGKYFAVYSGGKLTWVDENDLNLTGGSANITTSESSAITLTTIDDSVEIGLKLAEETEGITLTQDENGLKASLNSVSTDILVNGTKTMVINCGTSKTVI